MEYSLIVFFAFLCGYLAGFLDRTSKPKCKHTFGKWEDGCYRMQKRECEKCGLKQERYIKSINLKPWRK